MPGRFLLFLLYETHHGSVLHISDFSGFEKNEKVYDNEFKKGKYDLVILVLDVTAFSRCEGKENQLRLLEFAAKNITNPIIAINKVDEKAKEQEMRLASNAIKDCFEKHNKQIPVKVNVSAYNACDLREAAGLDKESFSKLLFERCKSYVETVSGSAEVKKLSREEVHEKAFKMTRQNGRIQKQYLQEQEKGELCTKTLSRSVFEKFGSISVCTSCRVYSRHQG